MQNRNDPNPFETTAVLLYNDSLGAVKQGCLEDAAESLCAAESLVKIELASSNLMKISIVACKVFFALGQFDKSQHYLDMASQYGPPMKILSRMQRAIEREKNLAMLPPRKGIADVFVSVFGGRSWIYAFCDWLEANTHKVCQGTIDYLKNTMVKPEGDIDVEPFGKSLIPTFLRWIENDIVHEFCNNLRGSFPNNHH